MLKTVSFFLLLLLIQPIKQKKVKTAAGRMIHWKEPQELRRKQWDRLLEKSRIRNGVGRGFMREAPTAS
jgi:hypothetical protein